VTLLNSRIDSRKEWDDAHRSDRGYLIGISPLGLIQTIAYEYITSNIIKIFICYILISILILTVPYMRNLTNNKIDSYSDMELLLPWVHLHLEIISKTLDNLIQNVLPKEISSLILEEGKSNTLSILMSIPITIILPFMAYDYFLQPIAFLVKYSPIFYWSVSYGLALALKVLVLIFIYSIRWIVGNSIAVLRIILRYTIWCQPIRRKFRAFYKNTKNHVVGSLGVPVYYVGSSFFTYFFGGMALLVAISTGLFFGIQMTWSRVVGPDSFLSMGTLFVSFSTVILIALVTILLFCTIIFPQSLPLKNTNNKYNHHTQISSLLFPLPLLCYPTFLFSWKLLFTPKEFFQVANPLFEPFGPERINFCICIMAIIIHLMISRRSK
jgi:hypothetical protein